MRKSTTMASSKKPKEEEKKKKSGSSGKEAKALKTPDKKTGTHKKQSKHKPKSDNKNNRSRNGTVDESEVPGDPSSSTESDESEPEREERSIKTKNERNKSPKPKKRKQKGGEEDDGDDEPKEEAKLCRIPMNRIKRIIKSGDCNKGITQDAIFLVNKATEKFIEQFCEDAYWFTVKDRKKSLSYKHLSSVVSKQKKYEFLSDFVPEKVKAEDALKEMKFSETELG